MQLALAAESKKLKIDAARYFEAKQQMDKAVLLYHKGGNVSRAVDICFNAKLFDSLRTIADDLGPETDPALLARCGDFFLEHGQFSKAVALFVSAQQPERALKLCLEHKVKIDEAMAEGMTPAKASTDAERQQRTDVLMQLAQICRDQGSFHLACKKYTQAGDKIRAVKCLLRSNDTEKIIYYAAMTKKKEIYVLAANYLQNMDWHNDPEIMKTIITFYTKAKAMLQLSVFYDACSQVEIDEYRDYEKALGALRESLKYMIMAKDDPGSGGGNKDEKLNVLHNRIGLVERFVEARKLVKQNPNEMINICHQLLDQPNIDSALRSGDIFALLIEFYAQQKNYKAAYEVVQKMQRARIILSPYLDPALIKIIHDSNGVPVPVEDQGGGNGGGNGNNNNDYDDIGEVVHSH
jgi:intraflagellar transport protein 140